MALSRVCLTLPSAVSLRCFFSHGHVHYSTYEYGFKDLWEYGPPQIGMGDSEYPPQWGVESIYHHRDTRFPHLKSTMISDVDGDGETLFRGELFALIRMIRGCLATKGFAGHTVYPVGVYPYTDPEITVFILPIKSHIITPLLTAFRTTGPPLLHDGHTTRADPPGPFQWHRAGHPSQQTL